MSLDWLKSVAPTVATVLGGPIAGLAVEVIGDALGMSGATKEAITETLQSGSLTSEQLAAVKVADINLKAKLKELDIKLEEVHAQNTASARDMQVKVKSKIPDILAIIVTVGFFGILTGMMLNWLDVKDNQALLILLGALGAAFGAVINFYFGSSKGSDDKTALISQMRK